MIFRIHGDNIIECERTLDLITAAYQSQAIRISNSLYFPCFQVCKGSLVLFDVELLAGHNRWGVVISEVIAKHGAPLREATDAYITRLSADKKTEEIILAIEYCNALPAGNNAWQRSGRAIACAEIGIPYLYFAEVGGVELDINRAVKAPRFPNPLVPFSYLTATNDLNVICIPVYEAHPAISEELRSKFSSIFGLADSLKLIRCLLDQTDSHKQLQSLIDKGTTLVQILSDERKRLDTFKGDEWHQFLNSGSGLQKAKWIWEYATHLIWQKKSSDKVNVSRTFKKLLTQVQKLNCLSIGAKEIPICIVPENKIADLTILLKTLYPIQKELHKIISQNNKPLVIVWITGFKPRGDDSRPDRGLVPLARMIFGNEVDILTIVYGPAKESTWRIFQKNPLKLAEINGLWEAVINLSNYVFTDSATSENGAMFYATNRKTIRQRKSIFFDKANSQIEFSEHDTDTAIHSLFSRREDLGIFESMCNPPGGDWSGVSVLDFKTKEEYRWTSLPRVSLVQGKRPDHVLQILREKELVFLSIESKNYGSDLENDIGKRLNTYLKELFSSPPTAYKLVGKKWQLYLNKITPIKRFTTLSGGAFTYKNDQEISEEMENGCLDFVFAFDFKHHSQPTILHAKFNGQSSFLLKTLTELCKQFKGGVEIQVH